jgi:hypothetical protein
MKKDIFLLVIMLYGIAPLVAQNDLEGSKDPVLLSRMPNHYISDHKELHK